MASNLNSQGGDENRVSPELRVVAAKGAPSKPMPKGVDDALYTKYDEIAQASTVVVKR